MGCRNRNLHLAHSSGLLSLKTLRTWYGGDLHWLQSGLWLRGQVDILEGDRRGMTRESGISGRFTLSWGFILIKDVFLWHTNMAMSKLIKREKLVAFFFLVRKNSWKNISFLDILWVYFVYLLVNLPLLPSLAVLLRPGPTRNPGKWYTGTGWTGANWLAC